MPQFADRPPRFSRPKASVSCRTTTGCASRPANRPRPRPCSHAEAALRSRPPPLHPKVAMSNPETMTIFAGRLANRPPPGLPPRAASVRRSPPPSPHPIWRSSQRSPRDTGRSIATAKYSMNVFALLHAPGARELAEPLLRVTTAVPRMRESRHDPPGVGYA